MRRKIILTAISILYIGLFLSCESRSERKEKIIKELQKDGYRGRMQNKNMIILNLNHITGKENEKR